VAVLTAAVALLIRTIGLAGLRELGLRLVQADPLLLALAAGTTVLRKTLTMSERKATVQRRLTTFCTIHCQRSAHKP
jgi:hypothetical protein